MPTVTEKCCVRCKTTKEHSHFGKRDNKGRLDSFCKLCRSAYFKTYYSEHRQHYITLTTVNKKRLKDALQAWVNEKKKVNCADCGGLFLPIVMDFDHLGQNKENSISKLVQMLASKTRILAEIAKCEVVCANCHRVRTFHRKQYVNKNKNKAA